MAAAKKILMIDDDANLVSVFRLVCEKKGYEFHSAGSAVQGLAAIEAVEPDLVILDVIMEDFVAGFRQMLDAFYALSALEAGQSEKEVRAALPTLMRVGKLELERESPRLAEYVEAIADFLEDGGALEIRAARKRRFP